MRARDGNSGCGSTSRVPSGRQRLSALVVLLAGSLFGVIGAAGCGDGSVQYVFRHTGSDGQVRSFVAATSDPVVIDQAREELARPAQERSLYIQGPVAEGDGDLNEGWDWHFVPNAWRLVSESLEICDGDPGFIDLTLQDWVEKIGHYCPRTARIAEER